MLRLEGTVIGKTDKRGREGGMMVFSLGGAIEPTTNYQAAPVMGLRAEENQAHTLNTGERIDRMQISLR
jgi:hypothetical protein